MPKQQPRATGDKDLFHYIYWMKFAAMCTPPWLEMTTPQKGRMVRAFIFEKFTSDPRGRCLLPEVRQKRKKRSDAYWPDFWLSETEVDGIVAQVMAAYEAAPPTEPL